MIFGVLFFAEKYLLSRTETTAQRYLWLYRHTVVKGILIVSPSYMYTQSYTLFVFYANFVFYYCRKKLNREIIWLFAFAQMPTLAQNAENAKSEKRDAKYEKNEAKYPAIHFLFFAFHDCFCIFRDKYTTGLRNREKWGLHHLWVT